MTIQVREATADADPSVWLTTQVQRLGNTDQALLSRALALAVESYAGRVSTWGEPLLTHSRSVVPMLHVPLPRQ